MNHETSVRPSKYIVCVDSTELSQIALRFACIKAKKRHIQIDLLHVIAPNDMQAIGSIANKIEAEEREQAEALLISLSSLAYELSGIISSLWIRIGVPAQEIVAHTMENHDANMLVLAVAPGSKSGNRVIESLMSEAGEKLLIPMMLVPGNLTDQQMSELG